jgi:hypothetical protein
MYGSFQHYANYCRFFLVPGHEKGAAANFSFCDNSTLNKNPPRRRNQRLRAGHREPCCFAIKTIGGSPVNGFVFISIRKADQTRAKT